MTEIINMKLVSGEEILAKVESETESCYEVSSPRILSIHDMGNGQAGATFLPALMLMGKDNCTINKSAIVMYTHSINFEYEKRYLESVSGIQLATSLQG